MKIKKIFLFVLLSIISFNYSYAQLRLYTKANEVYKTGQYFKAIDLLREAYAEVADNDIKKKIVFQVAECYRLTAQPRKAALWYRKVIKKDNPNPMAYLYYADALKINQEFDEAIENYKEYSKLVPEDVRGKNGIKSCGLAQKWIDNPNGYKVANMRFFNSRESEYGVAYAKAEYDEIYFTSSREESTGDDINGGTGLNFSDIFESQRDRKGEWSTPVPLNENINTGVEEGAVSMSKDFNTMFFTRCNVQKKKTVGCKIYESVKNGEEWSKAEPINIANDSLVVAHPSLSDDGLTLYFVSDIPGGKGKLDIWKITRESKDGEWSQPVNMGGNINTPGNEMFPFIHDDGTLYFSSDYHIGMGGLDIFRAENENGNVWKIENMRYPINSSYDDFGIVIEKDKERGYFSSSRDRDDEIFSFVLPPLKFSVEGIIKNQKTSDALPDATVKLVGSDGMTLSSKTDDNGSYKFMLRPNTDYVFVASKKGFLTGKDKETTRNLIESKVFFSEISLPSIKEPIELPNIFYDLAKWNLRPESMVALDKLVETLNDNPRAVIELRAHTDSRGSIAINIELSQKRAQSVVNFLIEKGIEPARLRAKGYAATKPKVVDVKIASILPFLTIGKELTPKFIAELETEEQQEEAYQVNRRTEFKVISMDFKPQRK
ncbi:MAG: OmpA family protein [Bacteroidales bacterium]|jgi:peptidoglycan-associated lipoprotein|nr:OmpA family protein [Bacteroidales bacterium]